MTTGFLYASNLELLTNPAHGVHFPCEGTLNFVATNVKAPPPVSVMQKSPDARAVDQLKVTASKLRASRLTVLVRRELQAAVNRVPAAVRYPDSIVAQSRGGRSPFFATDHRRSVAPMLAFSPSQPGSHGSRHQARIVEIRLPSIASLLPVGPGV